VGVGAVVVVAAEESERTGKEKSAEEGSRKHAHGEQAGMMDSRVGGEGSISADDGAFVGPSGIGGAVQLTKLHQGRA
jgi:hypothetical protein